MYSLEEMNDSNHWNRAVTEKNPKRKPTVDDIKEKLGFLRNFDIKITSEIKNSLKNCSTYHQLEQTYKNYLRMYL